jgi:hypothetical protein
MAMSGGLDGKGLRLRRDILDPNALLAEQAKSALLENRERSTMRRSQVARRAAR